MIRCLFSTRANISAKTDKNAKRACAPPKERFCRFCHDCQAVGTLRDAEPPGVRVETERLSLDLLLPFRHNPLARPMEGAAAQDMRTTVRPTLGIGVRRRRSNAVACGPLTIMRLL